MLQRRWQRFVQRTLRLFQKLLLILSQVLSLSEHFRKSYQYEVETALGTLLVNGTSEQLYETNETIHLAFPAEKLVILEK